MIKEGQKPIKEWQVTCKKCGCILFFTIVMYIATNGKAIGLSALPAKTVLLYLIVLG